VLNPTFTQLEGSDLNLVVAGTQNAVLMVESEANGLSEKVMLDAVLHGHEQMQAVISLIRELKAEVGKPAWDWTQEPDDEELAKRVAESATDGISEAYRITDKLERQARVFEVRSKIVEELSGAEDSQWGASEVVSAFSQLEKAIVRGWILDGQKRIDGRNPRRCVASHPRFGFVYPRRDSGARSDDIGYRPRCANHRRH
jgi:polyribonucleotide nucleotidyltransferase